MAPRKRTRPPQRRVVSSPAEGEMPSLLVLDQFSESSIGQWNSRAAGLSAIQSSLYFDLEPHRLRAGQQLLDAVRRSAIQEFQIEDWCRIVEYQYSLTPLSSAGSITGVGGRFNIGGSIAPGTITPFQALYIAEDYETAFRERFGNSPNAITNGLRPDEIALRDLGSFSTVRLRGKLDLIVDVGDLGALRPFIDVIKTFPVPRAALTTSRRLGMRRPPWLIRSATTLQKNLLHPSWRAMPMQFSVPANCQIFGRIAAAAGIHGVLYPSTKHSSKRCLALFPQNWKGSASFVEVADPVPVSATEVRIDGGPLLPN
jgi:RES domain-containing protein